MIAGPSGGGLFPSIDTLIKRLFDVGSGAFPALGGTLGQPGVGVRPEVLTLDAAAGVPVPVWSEDDLEVRAIGVLHGNTPSVAYRVRAGDRTIVFGMTRVAATRGSSASLPARMCWSCTWHCHNSPKAR